MLQKLQQKLRTLLEQAAPAIGQQEAASEELSLPLAAASLLFEVAWADHNVSATEEAALQRALAKLFALSDADSQEVLVASRKLHRDSVGVHPYTRLLNESLAAAEKFELLVQLWKLAMVDDGLSHLEEHRIRAIAELLYIEHADFIAAKQQARGSTS